jgi:hypothetical protein
MPASRASAILFLRNAMEKGEEAMSKLFECRPSSRWAPFWAYVATTVVIVFAQIDSDADWWLRVLVAVLAVAANVAIITAMHRRWGYGGKNEPDWQGR